MKFLPALALVLATAFSSQAQKGKEYFLVDSIVYDSLDPGDRALLDSLLTAYHRTTSDTAKLGLLETLSEVFGDPELWIRYNRFLYKHTKAKISRPGGLSPAELLRWKKSYARSVHNFGYYAFNYLENPELSRAYYDTCLELEKEAGDKYILAATLNNIGIIYQNEGNVMAALDYFLKSMKIEEEMGDKSSIANSYNNIGTMYMQQGDTAKSLEYMEKSIALSREAGFDRGTAFALSNTGAIYRDRKDYPKALGYFLSSIPLWEKVGEKQGLGFALLSIGFVYEKQGSQLPPEKKHTRDSLYALAMNFLDRAVLLYRENNSKQGLSHAFSNIASVHFSRGEHSKAMEFGEKALSLAREIGQPAAIRTASNILYKTYNKLGKSKEALAMHELYIQMRDSISNMETRKSTLKQQMKYEYEKEEAMKEAKHQKEVAVAEAEKRRHQLFLWFALAVAAAVAVIAVLIFRSLQVTRKQKLLIEDQKKIVDSKNKHITASINYAKRIQDAILPSHEELAAVFPDHFLFFRPREIVSGDFYWLSNFHDGKTILAVADCTGHGVPGAFMSMIGNTLLNEIVNEKHVFSPAEILNRLNEGIVHALHQESRSQDDGMDISICLFEKNKLTFAGANHSLYLIHGASVQESKGDFFSIGSMFGKKDFSFSETVLSIPENSSLYLFTDGFPDQLGGTGKKKFLRGNLQQLLLSVSSLPVKEQESRVSEAFDQWKGKNLQLDDVLLVGIKI